MDNYEVLPSEFPKYDIAFKVIVIGNSGVGKSCLSLKGVKNMFMSHTSSTIGFECYNFHLKYNDKIVRLQIWDTCGQEVYRGLVKSFFQCSSLAIIVYSIDDLQSFKSINEWTVELKNNASPDTKIFLIGNKNDLEDERVIEKKEGEALKESNHYDLFMETSAKTGFNAKELFINAAKLLMDDLKKKNEMNPTIDKDLFNDLGIGDKNNKNVKIEKDSNANSKKKKGCC